MQGEALPLEKNIVNRAILEIKKLGIRFVVKTHGSIFQAAGLPDIITIAPGGRFVGIEMKRSEKHMPTSLQRGVLNAINACGGYGVVAWSVDQVLAALTAASQGAIAPLLT